MRTITSKRFAVGLAAAIGLVLSSWCLAQNDKAEKPKGIVPPPKITISKETTWATEPLRDDGTIDYVEVLNRWYSKDVTAENNACVLLYQAIGPSPEGSQMPDRFFRRMGIEPLPDEGKYFQSWLGPLPDAVDRPWTAREHPGVAAWLKANELPLATVAAATERSRFYLPLVNPDAKPDGGMLSVTLSGLQTSRYLARALSARAMWELAEGSQVDAWRDLMTMHRLGRLVGQGSTLIEYLVGTAVETIAINGELRFLSETKPSPKMFALYRKQLDRLPARASVTERLVVAERICYLDVTQRVARGQTTLSEIADEVENGPLFVKLTDGVIAQSVDWDEVLKSGNKQYDQIAEISRKPDFLERIALLKKLEQEMKELVAERRRGEKLLTLVGNKPAITQAMSDTLISMLLPSIAQVHFSEAKIIQRMHNLELAFAMAAWRNEHDSYPETLEMLAPKYIAEVPKDLFNNQPLKYERIADGYRFYSVGQNGKDDEGRSFDEGADDLVVRMPVK